MAVGHRLCAAVRANVLPLKTKSVFSNRNGVIAAALLTTGFLMLLIAGGCWQAPAPAPEVSPKSDAAKSSSPAVPEATFVGNAACVECHTDTSRIHSHTGHAHTLRRLSRKELGPLAPPTGPIPRTGFVLTARNDGYVMGMPSQSDEVAPVEYVLGSGKTGMTFTSVVQGDRMVEFARSWFPPHKKWYITPGAEHLAPDDLGRLHSTENARKCFACHAVTLPADKPAPDPRFFGVGCEACHGPGSAHVAAMQAGKYGDSLLEKLGAWPASRLNDLCGKCHGTKQDVESQNLPRNMTNRMQPYGLMLSPCYKGSKDTLSCISCHDPHRDAATDVKTYEAVCLACHSAVAPPKPLPHVTRTPAQVCPVNPKTACIQCHMPTRPAIPGSDLPTSMADHFIRARPEKGLP